jgi:6-phosphogluconolactonase
MSQVTRWQVLENADTVAAEAARRTLAAAETAIVERGAFRIVLAGGRTPQQMHARLSRATADWPRWQVYFGDERCLPPDDEQRNSSAAAVAWLARVPLPTANVHPIPAELGAEAAAKAYAPLVAAALPFDLVVLGMGEDGHTASLFPGQQHPADELVHAVHDAPKPPPDRVSLSVDALSQAREIMVLVTGASKREAILAWRAGKILPVSMIGGASGVDVLLDRDADS